MVTQDNNDELSVMNMVRELSGETSTAEADLFRRAVTPVPVQEEEIIELADLDALDEDNLPALPTYSTDELSAGNQPTKLGNLIDDQATNAGEGQMNEMSRTHVNIEAAKARLGIKHLNIPTMFTATVVDCAASEDHAHCVEKLDTVLTDLIRTFPAAVVEWLPDSPLMKLLSTEDDSFAATDNSSIVDADDTNNTVDDNATDDVVAPTTANEGIEGVTVIIDKSQVTELSFTAEELEKIRRSRSVELKIVENKDLKYTVIEEPVDDIGSVLSQYTRKFNDRAVSLPASKYRCTVTGLSYPEIMDTYYTLKLNNGLDGEVRKWTIAYDHIQNPSIGPFVDFDDFLQKTSYIDINYILWNILCASAMAKEIVTLDCQREKCDNTYEWVYSPENLLRVEKIASFLLDEMKVTAEANSMDAIMANYNSSMLRLGNSIELSSSRFIVAFGHVSAYSYIREGIYATIHDATESENPSYLELVEAGVMSSIKYMLLPKVGTDSYYKVTDKDQLKKIIHGLDEMDFQTIGQLTDLMTEPYTMAFSIPDAVCPKCKRRADVSIKNISDLLFIISRSLETANVVLKN